MAARGSTDGEEHLGSFFWMVGRTSKANDANTELQNVTFEKSYRVALPAENRN